MPTLPPEHLRRAPFVSKHTPEEKAAILSALDALVEKGGITKKDAMKQIGAEYGMPHRTLENWVRERGWSKKAGGLAALRHRVKQIDPVLAKTIPSADETARLTDAQIADVLEGIVMKYADLLGRDDVVKSVRRQPAKAAIVMAVTFDKLQVIRGKPTSITESQVRYMPPGSLKAYVKELDVIEGEIKPALPEPSNDQTMITNDQAEAV